LYTRTIHYNKIFCSNEPHDRHSIADPRNVTNTSISNEIPGNQSVGGVAHSFMAALSAKLTGTVIGSNSGNLSAGSSPKPVRKVSFEQPHHQPQPQQQQQQQRNSKTSNEFLETLNAKLAQQQQQHQQHKQQQLQQQQLQQLQQQQQLYQQQQFLQQQQQQQQQRHLNRSASVRRFMANRVPILDPIQVRDSLMDQIRKGTSLRKTTGPINDRSAPKIY